MYCGMAYLLEHEFYCSGRGPKIPFCSKHVPRGVRDRARASQVATLRPLLSAGVTDVIRKLDGNQKRNLKIRSPILHPQEMNI